MHLVTADVSGQLTELGLGFPNVLGNTDLMEEGEWLGERRRGLGGADAAAAAGLSRWKSRYVLFMEKRAEVPIPQRETRRMLLGKLFEEPISQAYAIEQEQQLVRVPALLQHPNIPWMLANVDRFVLDPSTEQIGGALEVKMTDERMAHYWREGEAPIENQCQCIHYLAVTGLPWIDLTGLVGRDLVTLRIERDEESIANLISIEEQFWQLVQANTPPAADSAAAGSTIDLLKHLFPDPEPASRCELPSEARALIENRVSIVAQRKNLKEALDRVDAQLLQMMGPAELGYVDNELAFTWKQQHRDGYYVAPTDFRVARVPKRFFTLD